MHPDGVSPGIESSEARWEVDIGTDQIEQVVDPSKRRTSVERLEVYANAYYARLLECLRDEFPALLHAVGDEVFDGLAFGYLQTYPSTSYTLSNLSRNFARFLEETRPRDEDDPSPAWPDFMIDLARLERTYSEVFDGPGTERLTLLNADEIQAVPPEAWPAARLVSVPCLHLLALRYPVQEYATGVRKKENPPFPDPEPTWLAVSRVEYVVRRWTLTQFQYGTPREPDVRPARAGRNRESGPHRDRKRAECRSPGGRPPRLVRGMVRRRVLSGDRQRVK